MAHRGDPTGPPRSVRSDAAAFSSAESPRQHVSHPYGYAMTSQTPTAGTMWSPLAEHPPAVPFGEVQEVEQSGQCKSSPIFRAALLEALSLLHSPRTGGVSCKVRRGQPVNKVLRRHDNLRKQSMAPNSKYKDS